MACLLPWVRVPCAIESPRLLALALGLIGALSLWANAPTTLRTQLHGLAIRHGFTIENLSRVEDQPVRGLQGSVRHQLKQLLAGYNHVVLDSPDGRIEEVTILSRKEPVPTIMRQLTIAITRQGAHRVVPAILIGPNTRPYPATLVVDTGVSTVVLPASMSTVLGFTPNDLRDGWSRTANGPMAVQLGVLGAIEIGGVTASDVEVAFVPDHRLGEVKLLGMSFLERFRFTIDDANSELILWVSD